jgi:hypothetical protein
MPSDDAQPLPGLTFAFDRAYQACPPHVRVLPSRQQSPEILRLAAMACTQVSLHDLDEGEAQTIAHLAALARDPVKLEAFIAAAHVACRDDNDDFPASRLDPLARRGWCPLGQHIRFPKVEPWQRDMFDLVAELRAGTADVDGAALAARFGDNIRALPSSYAVPRNPEADAKACDMVPVTAAAFYLLCFERGLREQDDCIAAQDRTIRNLQTYICELEGRLVHAER